MIFSPSNSNGSSWDFTFLFPPFLWDHAPKELPGDGHWAQVLLDPGRILTAHPPWGYSGQPGLWAWPYPAREKGLPQAPFQPHGDGRAAQKHSRFFIPLSPPSLGSPRFGLEQHFSKCQQDFTAQQSAYHLLPQVPVGCAWSQSRIAQSSLTQILPSFLLSRGVYSYGKE